MAASSGRPTGTWSTLASDEEPDDEAHADDGGGGPVRGRAGVGGQAADLARAAKDYDLAQIKGDRAALERLLADDYVLVDSRATVTGKADLIRDDTAPGFKLDPYEVREPIERVWANGAVLGGIVTLSGMEDGKRFETTVRFADVWAKRKGVWRVIYTEVTKPPAT